MRYHLKLIGLFIRASAQQELAYRANFLISLLHSLLNFGTGLLGLLVLFEQVEAIRGWDFASTLAVLGVYLTVGAVRDLFIGPSLDALTGINGDIWAGRLDFTLMRPVDIQFWSSFRQWRLLAVFDLALGAGVLAKAIFELGAAVTASHLITFLILLGSGMITFYAVQLAFTGLMFWNPGMLFSWVFNGIFQMARYPVRLYPGGLRLALTWIVPVGVITTLPAQALTGDVPALTLVGSLFLAAALFTGASLLFRTGLRRYASASS
ncbi:MAG: ABC-2 family transporter protein [Chloroflexi bacterium]|nr:ABC-2 family transporter protein [Chloroflexota bacterium]